MSDLLEFIPIFVSDIHINWTAIALWVAAAIVIFTYSGRGARR